MNWVDLILNIAGLLLWLNWRAGKADPISKRVPATLVGTLRSTAPQRMRGWDLPLILGAFLFLRAVLYWLIGPALHWVAILDLGVISPSFRSDWFGRICLYSILSFALTLGIFYSCLVLLSLLKGPKAIHDFVRLQLGRIDAWPGFAKCLLPLLVTAGLWWGLSWLLAGLRIIPQPVSEVWRIEESLIIGFQSYLVWKFPLAILLAMYLLNSYIYFGNHRVWNYADETSQTILRPLRKIPLRVGKADFTPIVGIAAVFAIAELARRLLDILYKRLSF